MAKILIVEDDLELCTRIVEWLTFEQHTVEAVHDGREGSERLKFYTYELVILDWQLPNMTGLEICKKFRAGGGFTPILMLTGKGEVSDKEEGLDSGADDYLVKPFHMKELSARLRALMRRPSMPTGNVLKICCIRYFALAKPRSPERQVPKFRACARIKITPPKYRTPPGQQYRISSRLVPRVRKAPGFDVVSTFRYVISGSLAFVFIDSYQTRGTSRLPVTLNTLALYQSILRWFGGAPCRAPPVGLPPSHAQHSCQEIFANWLSLTTSSRFLGALPQRWKLVSLMIGFVI